MNERINKLFGQALDQAVPETWTTLTPAQLLMVKDKFAELIIKECVSIVNKRKDAAIDADWHVDEAMSNAVWDIEEHFGVEE